MEDQNDVGEMTLSGSWERHGQGQQRSEKSGDWGRGEGLVEVYFLQRKDTA